jgi:anthranilate synthase/aminodeoxychorismate synthase-like glutamine amidotransferase
MKILLIDNYDSFSFNLYDYLIQLNTSCTVIRNDEYSLSDVDEKFTFDAILISPGPKTPQTAGISMEVIHHYGSHKPILGICLGHQAIGIAFGARLLKASLPMHGKTSIISCNTAHPLLSMLPNRMEVMRYHSLIIDSLEQTPLLPLAHTENGEIMALSHSSLPIWGMQFHPESILTECGFELLRNWVDFCKKRG